jgi:hypothetical protein
VCEERVWWSVNGQSQPEPASQPAPTPAPQHRSSTADRSTAALSLAGLESHRYRLRRGRPVPRATVPRRCQPGSHGHDMASYAPYAVGMRYDNHAMPCHARRCCPRPPQSSRPASAHWVGRYRGLDSLTPRRLDVWPLHACSLPASPAILGLPALPRPLIGWDQRLCPIQSVQFAAAHVDAGRAQRPSVALWDLWDGMDGMGRVQDASRHPGMERGMIAGTHGCCRAQAGAGLLGCWAALRSFAFVCPALPCPTYLPTTRLRRHRSLGCTPLARCKRHSAMGNRSCSETSQSRTVALSC